MKDFKGKTAVITGAASGIGRAVAINLAGKGCNLAISDINEEGLKEVAREAERFGIKVHQARLDVADKEAFEKYAADVAKEFSQINIVVNNAGIGIAGTVAGMTVEDYEKTMGIHFWGVLYGTKFFLPHIRKAGEGHIVNISSVAGLMGFPGMSAYCAAKSAIRGFTESLRHELKDSNIGVSCVHPGGVATNIVKDGIVTEEDPFGGLLPVSNDNEAMHEKFHQMAMTSPEEAANIIVSGIESKRERVLVGPDAAVFDIIQRVLPENYGSLTRLLRFLTPSAD